LILWRMVVSNLLQPKRTYCFIEF